MTELDPVEEMKHRAEQRGVDRPERRRFAVMAILLALSLVAMVGTGIWAWQVQRDKALTLAQQIKLACDSGNFDPDFSREDREALCKNAERVIESNDPELQDEEIQEAEIQEPEIQESEIQEPEIQQPENQQEEAQDEESQEAEVQEPEIQDPEIQDEETQDPEIDDPDPAQPGTWRCPEGQYMVGVTRNDDGSLGVICEPINQGGMPPAAQRN